MKEFYIKEGNHYSFHWPRFHFGVKRMVVDYIFSDSCAYDLGTADQFDWNKLFGAGFGLNHHKNSYRIGWRFDPLSKKVQLSQYYYNKSVRTFMDMCSVNLNCQVRSVINFSRSSNTIWIKTMTFDNGKEILLSDFTIHFDFTKVPEWGTLLFPYFGGNRTAPHLMKISLDYKL